MRPSNLWYRYRRFTLAAVVLGLLAFLPLRASTQMMAGPLPDMMGEGAPGGGPDLPMFLRGASLRPDQRAQAQRILDRSHPAFARLFDQIHTSKQQLGDQLFAPGTVNSASLENTSRQLAGLQAQLADLELQTALQIRALLTPDQLSRVAEFHQKVESLHRQMHDLMRMNMPPPRPGPADPLRGPHPPGPPPPPLGE
jgi:Spy/CpxP family protein refolding chaperone